MELSFFLIAITNILFYYIIDLDRPSVLGKVYLALVLVFIAIYWALVLSTDMVFDVNSIYLFVGTAFLCLLYKFVNRDIHMLIQAPLLISVGCIPAVMSVLIILSFIFH